MKYIKLFEAWENNELSTFIEVLDFPRQNPEGYLMSFGEISISRDVIGSRYEPGYNAIVENPEILNSPEFRNLMDKYLIQDINIDEENDTIDINYFPMSRSEYYTNNYDDDGLSYEEYLEYF